MMTKHHHFICMETIAGLLHSWGELTNYLYSISTFSKSIITFHPHSIFMRKVLISLVSKLVNRSLINEKQKVASARPDCLASGPGLCCLLARCDEWPG